MSVTDIQAWLRRLGVLFNDRMLNAKMLVLIQVFQLKTVVIKMVDVGRRAVVGRVSSYRFRSITLQP